MAARLPMVYIVIPVHNRLEATSECLESLKRQTHQHFKIVLIDDGSTDGTSDYVREHYPNVVLLRGDGTLWWTGATNLGVRYAFDRCHSDDYILTLNNDTVLPATYLETILGFAEQAPKALIGSIARDYHRRDVCVDEGVQIHWPSAKFRRIKTAQNSNSHSFYSVSALPGRGTLIPVRLFRVIGLYDQTTFPHYAADYDLSLRAARIGYRLLLHPKCYLYSRTDLTGISNVQNQLTFLSLLQSFTSIRSTNNLKVRLRFGLRHAPLGFLPIYIVCDVFRVILGAFRNQLKNVPWS